MSHMTGTKRRSRESKFGLRKEKKGKYFKDDQRVKGAASKVLRAEKGAPDRQVVAQIVLTTKLTKIILAYDLPVYH